MPEATTKKAAATTEAATPEIDIKSWNIFQRVSAITDELGVVAKNLSVKAGGGSYKAVSERDIIDAVKPLETKYRVYSYPSAREILESEMLEKENNYGKSTTYFTRVRTEYTFINIDKPEDRFSTTVFSEGIDPGDKGSGKAMTYADKYALMKAYKISTGDDPDQNASEESHYTRTGNGNRGGQGGYNGNQNGYGNNQNGYGNNQYGNGNRGYQPPQQAPQHQQDAQGIKIKCKQCGNLIGDAMLTDDTMLPASQVAYRSMKQFGQEYCASCQQKLIAIRSGQGQK